MNQPSESPTPPSGPHPENNDSSRKTGIVALVGAGPGNPELLTLRGHSWLSRCDVVLYDGLSNAEMLAHAPQAEHICVGKHGQSRIWKQPEIIAETLRHAQAGRTVVRLKGGDPAVFARTSEEVDALVDAKIPFEIVPGITAALAAGSYAGIPITHRGIASAVALVTGHEEPGKPESALNWKALAAFPGTLVIYMGVTTAEAWTRALLDNGKSPDTPCAIIRRCSLPDQQQISCRLDEVAGHLTPASKFRPPVITIVGEVTRLSETMAWFSRRPLHGQRVLVTRPEGQADELARPLEDMGATVFRHSVIHIQPPNDWSEVDAAIDALSTFSTVIFSSTNAAEFFLNRIFERGFDLRVLAGARIAAVGNATASKLAEYHLRADIVPQQANADGLVEELSGSVAGQHVLIVRANRGSRVLPDGLQTAGAHVHEIAAYQNVDVETADPAISEMIGRGEINWVTVTSSATADNLHRLFGDSLNQCRFAAISSITADALRSHGYRVDAIAQSASMTAIAEAIADAPQE
ncbi:uroporphyrinogen-III C-methyltransferase [Rhodopirellula sallentina]|uniref:uroporphyrinogen-III C-methyltransferase n=1 Tax=Rhodopirellula sallentina SM41 TaxID=1263870 RepID=M5UP62_9BACT|nr:uroporphyrinogen-III C-methyltransferase [Rhodopirellula sallentina]EMI57788.1 uroporphyrinogen III synthase/methyltransferase [Rhodopirellula sallentina SM41]